MVCRPSSTQRNVFWFSSTAVPGRRQIAGLSGDGDADDTGIIKGLVIFLTKQFYRSVGVGMALKISDILS